MARMRPVPDIVGQDELGGHARAGMLGSDLCILLGQPRLVEFALDRDSRVDDQSEIGRLHVDLRALLLSESEHAQLPVSGSNIAAKD